MRRVRKPLIRWAVFIWPGMNERVSKHFSTMLDLRLTQLDTLIEAIPMDTREDSDSVREWLEYNAKIRGLEFNCLLF